MAQPGQGPDEPMPADPAAHPAAPPAPPGPPVVTAEVTEAYLSDLLAGSVNAGQLLTASCLASTQTLHTLSLDSLSQAARTALLDLLQSLNLPSETLQDGPLISVQPVGQRGSVRVTLQVALISPAAALSVSDACHAHGGLLVHHTCLQEPARFLFQHDQQDTALACLRSPAHLHLNPAAVLQLAIHCPALRSCTILWAGTVSGTTVTQRFTQQGVPLAPLPAPCPPPLLRQGDTCILLAGGGTLLRQPTHISLTAQQTSLQLTLRRIPNRLHINAARAQAAALHPGASPVAAQPAAVPQPPAPPAPMRQHAPEPAPAPTHTAQMPPNQHPAVQPVPARQPPAQPVTTHTPAAQPQPPPTHTPAAPHAPAPQHTAQPTVAATYTTRLPSAGSWLTAHLPSAGPTYGYVLSTQRATDQPPVRRPRGLPIHPSTLTVAFPSGLSTALSHPTSTIPYTLVPRQEVPEDIQAAILIHVPPSAHPARNTRNRGIAPNTPQPPPQPPAPPPPPARSPPTTTPYNPHTSPPAPPAPPPPPSHHNRPTPPPSTPTTQKRPHPRPDHLGRHIPAARRTTHPSPGHDRDDTSSLYGGSSPDSDTADAQDARVYQPPPTRAPFFLSAQHVATVIQRALWPRQ